jgi:hypothetical protein
VWLPEFGTALQLGAPLGPHTVEQSGLYRRRFRRGIVLVNPTQTAITTRLRGTYFRWGYSRTDFVKLPPASGAVLLRVSMAR